MSERGTDSSVPSKTLLSARSRTLISDPRGTPRAREEWTCPRRGRTRGFKELPTFRERGEGTESPSEPREASGNPPAGNQTGRKRVLPFDQLAEPVLRDLLEQRRAVDPEEPRRLRAAVLAEPEHLRMWSLSTASSERSSTASDPAAWPSAQAVREVLEADDVSLARGGPRARSRFGARGCSPATRTSGERFSASGVRPRILLPDVRPGELLEEVVRERQDLVAPLAERRDHDRHDVQAVEEVRPEAAGLHGPLEIRVRGGDDPRVHPDRRVPPSLRNRFSSSTFRSLACTEGASSPISSRKRLPPCASSSMPRLNSFASVKAPFSWPKSSDSRNSGVSVAQLRSTKEFAARALSSWMSRAATPLPVPVSPWMRTLVAGLDARRGSSRRRPRESRCATEEAREARDLLLQVEDLGARPRRLEELRDEDVDAPQVDGLHEEVVRLQLHRLHGRVHVAVGRDEDDARLRGERLDALEDLEPVHVRQPEVQEDDVDHRRGADLDGLAAGRPAVRTSIARRPKNLFRFARIDSWSSTTRSLALTPAPAREGRGRTRRLPAGDSPPSATRRGRARCAGRSRGPCPRSRSRREERLEDPLREVARNRRALVPDLDDHAGAVRPRLGRRPIRAAPRRVRDRVLEEVQEDLVDLVLVDEELGQVLREEGRNPKRLLDGEPPVQRDRAPRRAPPRSGRFC